MFFLYHVIMVLLLPGIVGILLLKAMRRRDYIANFFERFGRIPPYTLAEESGGLFKKEPAAKVRAKGPCFWIHAVSAGEVTAAIPLVAAIGERYPQGRIVISTATPAGRAVMAASGVAVDRVFYLPLDFACIVRRVVARIAPTIFLIVETDLWPALLRCLARRNIPCLLVNGRISRRRVKWGFFFRPIFGLLRHMSVQTDVDAERLMKIGVPSRKLAVTGNLKFTQALGQLEAPRLADPRCELPTGSVLLIAGSTHPGEEEELLDCYRRLRDRACKVLLMIAPRHTERIPAVEGLIRRFGHRSQRWSAFDGWRSDTITLVDSVGHLARLYSLAHFVFVGGSFIQRGGHNILEPAAWGKAIFFGPYMENYSSIAEATEREGAAIRVRSGAELASQIERLIGAPEEAAAMGEKAFALVMRNQGVVERNMAIIDDLLGCELGVAQARYFGAAITPKAL